jgi:hypothetical protein
MKDGMRFVDCDMHINEPPELFSEWLDPAFQDRVLTPVSANGRPKRGMWIVDGLPSSADDQLQQYRKPLRRPGKERSDGSPATRQTLSSSRLAATGRLEFAIERNFNAEAQVMALEMEGVDIAVLFPTSCLSLSGATIWIHNFRSPCARPTTTGSRSSVPTVPTS